MDWTTAGAGGDIVNGGAGSDVINGVHLQNFDTR